MAKGRIVCTTLLIETSPQALPLGAACIASSMKHDKIISEHFDVSLIAVSKEDKGFTENTSTDFIVSKICEDGVPDIVCFSVYVWNRLQLEEAAFSLKKLNPDLITIAGGPEVTANPLSFKNFDYCVSGAGEYSDIELVQSIIKGDEKTTQGVYTPKSSGAKWPESLLRSLSPDLETLSSPYLDGTLDVSKYGGALWELARGCPFKCSYCYESKGEKKIKYFPIERIEKELELFNQKKISQVFVLDPTYNASKKRAIELLNLIQKKAPGMFFYFEARAEFIDRELAKAFTKIPCALQFGLQSADPEVLKLVNRTLDKKLFTKNIRYLNEEGAVFGFDLIFGLPGDTLEGFKKSIDFALNLYPNNLETFCLSVLPGTDLYEKASELGLEWRKEPPYTVYKTSKYSEKDIESAGKISHSVNIFYNNGRAVPWFNSLMHYLKKQPSIFLEDFAKWFEISGKTLTGLSIADYDYKFCNDQKNIENLILEFLKKYRNYSQNEWLTVENIIKFNGALSRVEAEGREQLIQTNFHPDDLASEYAMDIRFFAQNAQRKNYKVRCFKNKNHQTDWATIR